MSDLNKGKENRVEPVWGQHEKIHSKDEKKSRADRTQRVDSDKGRNSG